MLIFIPPLSFLYNVLSNIYWFSILLSSWNLWPSSKLFHQFSRQTLHVYTQISISKQFWLNYVSYIKDRRRYIRYKFCRNKKLKQMRRKGGNNFFLIIVFEAHERISSGIYGFSNLCTFWFHFSYIQPIFKCFYSFIYHVTFPSRHLL
jgi:hypothetical protein